MRDGEWGEVKRVDEMEWIFTTLIKYASLSFLQN